MELTVRELRQLIHEAIGDRGWPGDKAHLICYVLAQAGTPMTRPDVMRKVAEIEGKPAERFKPQTNNSYWAPATVKRSKWQRDEQGEIVRDPQTHYPVSLGMEEVPNEPHGAYRSGVLVRGLVKAAGKKGHALLYTVTEKGQQFAEETAAWLQQNPDAMGNIAPESTWEKWERNREPGGERGEHGD